MELFASFSGKYEEDVLIFVHCTPADRTTVCGPKLLGRFCERSAERAPGQQWLREEHLQNDDGCVTFLALQRKNLGKEAVQDVSEHYQRYLHRGPRRYCPSIQAYIAEEAPHHGRALKAVQSVEKGTENLLVDSLRGFLRAEKSYRYTGISKALRDTW